MEDGILREHHRPMKADGQHVYLHGQFQGRDEQKQLRRLEKKIRKIKKT